MGQGILPGGHREALRDALRKRWNILVCGGTGSGKTTLANALLKEAVELALPHFKDFVGVELIDALLSWPTGAKEYVLKSTIVAIEWLIHTSPRTKNI